MEEKELYNLTIRYYLDLLRVGTDTEFINEINDFLSSKISGVSGGFDLQLFQLQKDLLLLMCKLNEQNLREAINLDYDKSKQSRYLRKIETIRGEIKRKTELKGEEEPNLYKSFLEWILSLKKYYGSDIDLDNDLMYLISATEQMMKFYAARDEQLQK